MTPRCQRAHIASIDRLWRIVLAGLQPALNIKKSPYAYDSLAPSAITMRSPNQIRGDLAARVFHSLATVPADLDCFNCSLLAEIPRAAQSWLRLRQSNERRRAFFDYLIEQPVRDDESRAHIAHLCILFHLAPPSARMDRLFEMVSRTRMTKVAASPT